MQNFASKLNQPKPKKVWDMIRKISAKKKKKSLIIYPKPCQSNIKISQRSSGKKLLYPIIIINSSKILRIMQTIPNSILNSVLLKITIICFFFFSLSLCLSQLSDSIMKSHNTAVGPDKIH